MTKLLMAAGVFAASYVWNPGFSQTVDAQMRIIAWKINSAVDGRVAMPFGGRR
jgi:hypothetical protein